MSATLRVLIADDEPAARAKLRRLLRDQPDAVVVGEASDGREAVAAVTTLVPDLLLLDIRMPELDGFEVLEHLGRSGAGAPKVIFVTAHDEFALRAFEVRAFDYLLKPFDARRLTAALDRVRHHVELEHRPSAAALDSLLAQLRGGSANAEAEVVRETGFIDRITIRSIGETRLVPVSDVEWFEAYGNYVRLHGAEGRPLARDTIRRLMERLDPARFVRVHRSAIVNLARVKDIRPLTSGDAVIGLTSGVRLRVSRSFRGELTSRLKLR